MTLNMVLLTLTNNFHIMIAFANERKWCHTMASRRTLNLICQTKIKRFSSCQSLERLYYTRSMIRLMTTPPTLLTRPLISNTSSKVVNDRIVVKGPDPVMHRWSRATRLLCNLHSTFNRLNSSPWDQLLRVMVSTIDLIAHTLIARVLRWALKENLRQVAMDSQTKESVACLPPLPKQYYIKQCLLVNMAALKPRELTLLSHPWIARSITSACFQILTWTSGTPPAGKKLKIIRTWAWLILKT